MKREREERGEGRKKKKKLEKGLESDVLRALKKKDLIEREKCFGEFSRLDLSKAMISYFLSGSSIGSCSWLY